MLWKILLIILIINAVLVYLVILGANKCKSEFEREQENQLEILYIEEINNKKKNKRKKKNKKIKSQF